MLSKQTHAQDVWFVNRNRLLVRVLAPYSVTRDVYSVKRDLYCILVHVVVPYSVIPDVQKRPNVHQQAPILHHSKLVLYTGSWVRHILAPYSVIRNVKKRHVLCRKRPVLYTGSCHSAMFCHMGWLRLVGSFKLYDSFAEYSLFYRALLQKRPIVLRSPPIIATPYPTSKRDSMCISRHLYCIWRTLQCTLVYRIGFFGYNIGAWWCTLSHIWRHILLQEALKRGM